MIKSTPEKNAYSDKGLKMVLLTTSIEKREKNLNTWELIYKKNDSKIIQASRFYLIVFLLGVRALWLA